MSAQTPLSARIDSAPDRDTPPVQPRGAHSPFVITFSGPVRGAGKTSLAAAAAIALLRAGTPAGVLDLDVKKRDLSLWLKRRVARFSERPNLVMPAAATSDIGGPDHSDEAAARDVAAYVEALGQACEAVVIDAPAGASELTRAAHRVADVIVTVIPESAADIAKLFEVDEHGLASRRPARYGRMIWEAVSRRSDASAWILIASRGLGEDDPTMSTRIEEARRLLGAGVGPRVREDAAWRNGFDEGLTPLE